MRYRSHAAITFTAGLLRALSIVSVIGSLIAGTLIFDATRNAVVSFGGLVVGLVQATVLWALADAMTLLADGDNAHARLEQMVAQALSRNGAGERSARSDRSDFVRTSVVGPAPRVTLPTKEAHVMRPNVTPGYRAYSKRTMARLVVDATLLESPREWAPVVLAVKAGDSVALLGEVGSFVFAETGAGDGWLAKSAIAP